VSGVVLNEEVDLALEFSKYPSKYQHSDWSLVQMEHDYTGAEVKTMLYLQTVKRTSPYLKYADAASDVGGFYIFITFVFSKLVNCVN
jgi:hypothetical protein